MCGRKVLGCTLGTNTRELAYLRGSPCACTTQAVDRNKAHIFDVLYGCFRVQLWHLCCILFDAYCISVVT